MQATVLDHAKLLLDFIFHFDTLTLNWRDSNRTKVEKMSKKMTEFIMQYEMHSIRSVPEFASYLNHDALSPLTIVVGYAELFRSVHVGLLDIQQLSVINEICEMSRVLTEAVRMERDQMVEKRNALLAL